MCTVYVQHPQTSEEGGGSLKFDIVSHPVVLETGPESPIRAVSTLNQSAGSPAQPQVLLTASPSFPLILVSDVIKLMPLTTVCHYSIHWTHLPRCLGLFSQREALPQLQISLPFISPTFVALVQPFSPISLKKKLILKYFNLFMCMYIYIPGALELELEAIVNCFMWALGSKLQPL